ncbi:MAG TPA: type II secretion system protein GspM [Bryobacteraceae bacterium]|nr:type II secretion system protein GspM [Bryobacteraceae bacterium]
MTLQPREKKLVQIGAIAAAVILAITFLLPGEPEAVKPVTAVQTIPDAEKRLVRVRQLAAAVPGKEQVLAQVSAELADREKGLIQAATAAQAQAQLLQILRRLARTENIDLRNTEIGQVKAFSPQYGEVLVATNFDCSIEQLLNLLASITAQKELLGTYALRIGSANPKQKTIPVYLGVSGLVHRSLIPDSKKEMAF